jgi:putative acetyltransferase
MRFSLRPYQPGDAEPIAKLQFDSVRRIGARAYTPEQAAAWAPEPWPPAKVHDRATDGRTTLVAVDELDEVIGCCDLEPNGHLDHLYCHPDFVGQGVGGALIDNAVALAQNSGVTRIYVEASEVALPIFVRKRFEVIERSDFLLRGVAIHHYRMQRTFRSSDNGA